ncbi:MAG: ROK family protein [Candidatus Sedimenticola sp. 20ELBAFRAG]
MRIGIDLGGTKIEGVVMNRDGEIIHRLRSDTPSSDYSATLQAIKSMLETLEAEVSTHCSIGIGTPGSISPSRGVLRNSNSVCLNDRHLQQDLEHLLLRPIRLANDADCFTLSEAIDGAATGAKSVFGVIIGTGTGGGIVIDGKLVSGPNGVAGEWGHNPLPRPTREEMPGPECYCGRSGCIETFLSGPGLTRHHALLSGKTLTAKEISRLAQEGDRSAEQTLCTYEDRLARGLASIINVLDPEVIVLGGGLSNIQRLYHNVPRQWEQYVFSDSVTTRLVPPHHGDSSGVRGAAWLWPHPPRK